MFEPFGNPSFSAAEYGGIAQGFAFGFRYPLVKRERPGRRRSRDRIRGDAILGYYEKRPTVEELRATRRRRLRRLAIAAVAAAVGLATLTLVSGQAGAVDANPPFRKVSDPGNYPLHGVHGQRISRTIVTSAGAQYRKRHGVYEYRPRWAVQGSKGRLMKVLFKDLSFYRHGFDEFRRCQSGCVLYGSRVVLVGRWRRVVKGEDWSTDGNVQATYLLGATSGLKGFASYRMRAPWLYPVAGPTFW